MLQLKNVGLVRNGKPILHDLNLETRRGEIHSILGANGTGKSTLASVILGLSGYRDIDGAILFNGAVGQLDIDYEADLKKDAVCELDVKAYGKKDDRIRRRCRSFMNNAG